MVKELGIEKVDIYGSSLRLRMSDFASARGNDPDGALKNSMIHTRSIIPLYEDVVTMAVNAAAPMLTDGNKEQIGLLVFGTERGTDFYKPVLTHVHEALGQRQNVRNFTTKHACTMVLQLWSVLWAGSPREPTEVERPWCSPPMSVAGT